MAVALMFVGGALVFGSSVAAQNIAMSSTSRSGLQPANQTGALAQLGITPIGEVRIQIAPPLSDDGSTFLPDESQAQQLVAEQPTVLEHETDAIPRLYTPGPAARFCHLPLYFEHEQLERHGITRRPLLQPVLSGARFYAGLAALPYKSLVERPRECHNYTYPYQAGRRAPDYRKRYPLRLDAGLFEAGVVIALVAVMP